jgi:hypothetical protein
MPQVSKAFFVTGALCGLVGMVWGAWMGASQDHSLFPAHAHLNLLGWVTLAIMGGFYALRGSGGRLAWINYGLSTAGVVIMTPMLAYLLGDEAHRGATIGPLMMIPEVLVMAGMAVFIYGVLTTGPKAAAKTPLAEAA